jgi:hypothetical protein
MDAEAVPADDGAVPAGGRGHIGGIVSDRREGVFELTARMRDV